MWGSRKTSWDGLANKKNKNKLEYSMPRENEPPILFWNVHFYKFF